MPADLNTQSQARLQPEWIRHPYRGWVCRCGYHGKNAAGRAVHERRAARGIGCKVMRHAG